MGILQFSKANCKNCYKCVRHCPVKAIRIENHQAQIMDDACILCGHCIRVCPQNAKQVRKDLDKVYDILGHKEVYASVAPSYIAMYPVGGFHDMRKALKQLGFTNAFETAAGAHLVKTQYETILDKDPQKAWISTCCPTVVRLVQKYYPSLLPHLLPVLSPMQAQARQIKKQHPQAAVVFIGPCISKKEEKNELEGLCDEVLTFEELNEWLEHEKIVLENTPDKSDKKRSRFFPLAGGIIRSMQVRDDISYLAVDGIDKCREALEELKKGHIEHCFIEMSACSGSCIGGHATGSMWEHPMYSTKCVERVAKTQEDFSEEMPIDLSRMVAVDKSQDDAPCEEDIGAILHQMGKFTKEDELNCGTCGYDTCRDKAIAVYHKKADITMCLPYMMKKAESFSDQILRLTPNGIVTVGRDFVIRQVNRAACDLWQADENSVVGKPIADFMEEYDFVYAIAHAGEYQSDIAYLSRYNAYVQRTFVYDPVSDVVICVMQDITKQKEQQARQLERQKASADLADALVEKQLRVVQQIASLLGETAAETKVAVNRLKDTILKEDETDETACSAKRQS